jgi:hypothetical protein
VLPAECLPYLGQLNPGTSFNVVCCSQSPVPGAGVAQTAVVDLSPPGAPVGPGGSYPLFMLPQDVPMVQELNGGMQITPSGLFQLPSNNDGQPTQIEQVQITAPGQNQAGATGCLLVCPVPTLPLLGQLNPGLSLEVLCTSQAGSGKVAPGVQTALLDIQPAAGKLNPSQPLPLWVPVDMLPALGQLNVGASMDIIDTTEMPAGGSMLPVALVDIQQNPKPLGTGNTGQSGSANPAPPAASSGDSGDDSGDDDGGGKHKKHGEGSSKDHHEKDGGDD